jgi:predicted dehydrogenase
MTRVAVIGAGHWGKNLIHTLYALGELAAIVEVDPDMRKQITEKYPDVPIYHSYVPILNSDIPAVAVATPAPTHFKIAREVLLANKDVFVEKPLTLSASEGEELTRIAETQGRILMVGHLLLYQPAIQTMKDMIETGEIGSLYSLHQRRAKLGRVRTVENVLWSFGVHDLAVLLYLVGKKPTKLVVSGQKILQPEIEDDVCLHLSFPGNVQAHLHTSWLWPEQERRLIAIGSKGMLVYDEMLQTVTKHKKGVHPNLTIQNEGCEKVFEGEQQPLKIELVHFLECVSTRRPPLSDGKNGVEVIRLIEQAMKQLKGEEG